MECSTLPHLLRWYNRITSQPPKEVVEAEVLAELNIRLPIACLQAITIDIKRQSWRQFSQDVRSSRSKKTHYYIYSYCSSIKTNCIPLDFTMADQTQIISSSPDGTVITMNAWIDPSNSEKYLKLATPIVAEFRKHPENLYAAISVNPTDKGHIRIEHGWTKNSAWFFEVHALRGN